jgi:hypothetical protein
MQGRQGVRILDKDEVRVVQIRQDPAERLIECAGLFVRVVYRDLDFGSGRCGQRNRGVGAVVGHNDDARGRTGLVFQVDDHLPDPLSLVMRWYQCGDVHTLAADLGSRPEMAITVNSKVSAASAAPRANMVSPKLAPF